MEELEKKLFQNADVDVDVIRQVATTFHELASKLQDNDETKSFGVVVEEKKKGVEELLLKLNEYKGDLDKTESKAKKLLGNVMKRIKNVGQGDALKVLTAPLREMADMAERSLHSVNAELEVLRGLCSQLWDRASEEAKNAAKVVEAEIAKVQARAKAAKEIYDEIVAKAVEKKAWAERLILGQLNGLKDNLNSCLSLMKDSIKPIVDSLEKKLKDFKTKLSVPFEEVLKQIEDIKTLGDAYKNSSWYEFRSWWDFQGRTSYEIQNFTLTANILSGVEGLKTFLNLSIVDKLPVLTNIEEDIKKRINSTEEGLRNLEKFDEQNTSGPSSYSLPY